MERTVSIPRLADGTIGIGLSADSAGRPIVVSEPPPGAAGLIRIGDVILAIDGNHVSSVEMVQAVMQQQSSASAIEMTVLRPSPIVQPIQWATSALSISPGAILEVPITVEEPSVGRYAFECSDGKGIVFSLTHRPNSAPDGQVDTPLLLSAAAAGAVRRGDGSLRVPMPGLVIARLDNTGSTFSTAVSYTHLTLPTILLV